MRTLSLTAADSPDAAGRSTPVWLDILKFYGLGTLLAIGFFIWLTRSVDADLKTNSAKTDAVKAALDQHSTTNDLHQAATRAIQEQQLKALVALCRNSATSARERELCGVVK